MWGEKLSSKNNSGKQEFLVKYIFWLNKFGYKKLWLEKNSGEEAKKNCEKKVVKNN